MTFSLTFRAYNGMSFVISEGLDKEEARDEAAKYLLDAIEDHCEVSILDRGRRWEIQTASNINGIAITDDDGILRIEAVAEPEDEEEEGWWDDAA